RARAQGGGIARVEWCEARLLPDRCDAAARIALEGGELAVREPAGAADGARGPETSGRRARQVTRDPRRVAHARSRHRIRIRAGDLDRAPLGPDPLGASCPPAAPRGVAGAAVAGA